MVLCNKITFRASLEHALFMVDSLQTVNQAASTNRNVHWLVVTCEQNNTLKLSPCRIFNADSAGGKLIGGTPIGGTGDSRRPQLRYVNRKKERDKKPTKRPSGQNKIPPGNRNGWVQTLIPRDPTKSSRHQCTHGHRYQHAYLKWAQTRQDKNPT